MDREERLAPAIRGVRGVVGVGPGRLGAEPAVSPALEKLAELVRQAEAKTRARKIEGETQHAAEQFRAAELRARKAVERLRVVRPASLRALEQADHEEQLLKDLMRKLAQFKSSLNSETDAERLIETSRAEIENARRRARADLEDVGRDVEEARRDLRTATDAYRNLRREIDRLQPELAEQFAVEDRLLWDAEAHFPGGQLQLLAHEVDAGMAAFGALGKLEQYARLKVWIGRFRHYQAAHDRDAEMTEELQALSHRVFHQLKFLSRTYEPGYIEAFRQDFSTDWAAYVAEAQEQLIQAVENSRRARDTSDPRDRDRDRDRPSTIGSRVVPHPSASISIPRGGTASLAELRSLVARARLPEEGLVEFLDLLKQTVEDVGPSHPELLRLALPFREHIAGENGLDILRRTLEGIQARRDQATLRDDNLDDDDDHTDEDEDEDDDDFEDE